MPNWLKVVLGLFVAGVLAVGLIVGGAAWWIAKNKDRIAQEGQVAEAEGRAFGATHTMNECVVDGLDHLKPCGGADFMCQALAQLRLKACVPVAREDGTCDHVPARSEIVKGAFWGKQECSRRGQPGSQPCAQLLTGLVEACRPMQR